MSTKRWRLAAVVVAAAGFTGRAAAQAPAPPATPGTMAPPAKPLPAPPVPDKPTAAGVLTGVPDAPQEHPPGTVTSPWVGSGPAGGPGGNGPLTYEIILESGPSLPVAGGVFSGKLNTGWLVSGGVRTLYFNTDSTAAWVLNLGLSYVYNRGQQDRPYQVFVPAPRNASGNLTAPDGFEPVFTRGLHRTNFNFGIGRDWYARGPAAVGQESWGNWRFGWDGGGRWGTAHADLVPVADVTNYLRKSGITHAVYLGLHANWEVPMGAWIFVSGFRTEWEYMWSNIVPPQDGNLQSVNLLFNIGVRY